MSSVQIYALDHLVLTVSDLSATVAFYERLGMQREMFNGDRIALHFGAQKLNLHRTGAEVEPHARYPTVGSADLCFLVEGPLEQVFDALATAGIRVELGPVERTGATGPMRSLYVRDPDGNLVELSEMQAGSGAHHRPCWIADRRAGDLRETSGSSSTPEAKGAMHGHDQHLQC